MLLETHIHDISHGTLAVESDGDSDFDLDMGANRHSGTTDSESTRANEEPVVSGRAFLQAKTVTRAQLGGKGRKTVKSASRTTKIKLDFERSGNAFPGYDSSHSLDYGGR